MLLTPRGRTKQNTALRSRREHFEHQKKSCIFIYSHLYKYIWITSKYTLKSPSLTDITQIIQHHLQKIKLIQKKHSSGKHVCHTTSAKITQNKAKPLDVSEPPIAKKPHTSRLSGARPYRLARDAGRTADRESERECVLTPHRHERH